MILTLLATLIIIMIMLTLQNIYEMLLLFPIYANIVALLGALMILTLEIFTLIIVLISW
jgi:hypothetical protein